MTDLSRIANALERIALAMEGREDVTIPVTLQLDGRVLAHEVIRQNLRRASRGPSPLTGGSLGRG